MLLNMALTAACAVSLGYNGFFSRSPVAFVAEDNTECYRLLPDECGTNNAWGFVVGPNVEGTERVVEFYVQPSKAPSSVATALFQSAAPAAYQVLATRFDDATRVVTATLIVYACGPDPIDADLGIPSSTGFEQVGADRSTNIDKEYGLILVLIMLCAALFMFAACAVTRRTKIVLPRWQCIRPSQNQE
jgi:hypothetical protein